mgnify:CR=1 FL=1
MRAFLVCLLISMFPAAAQAAIVQLEMRPGITANAEYLIGERSKPAVLLIHGFLQTREFPTVATLARGLRVPPRIGDQIHPRGHAHGLYIRTPELPAILGSLAAVEL